MWSVALKCDLLYLYLQVLTVTSITWFDLVLGDYSLVQLFKKIVSVKCPVLISPILIQEQETARTIVEFEHWEGGGWQSSVQFRHKQLNKVTLWPQDTSKLIHSSLYLL